MHTFGRVMRVRCNSAFCSVAARSDDRLCWSQPDQSLDCWMNVFLSIQVGHRFKFLEAQHNTICMCSAQKRSRLGGAEHVRFIFPRKTLEQSLTSGVLFFFLLNCCHHMC